MREIYEKFSEIDKSIFNCLSLMEKEKTVIHNNEKKYKAVEGKVKQLEKDMSYCNEHIHILNSKLDVKHQRKTSNSKHDA